MCLKKYLLGKLYILGAYSMIPQHIVIVWGEVQISFIF